MNHWKDSIATFALRQRDFDRNGHVNHAAMIELCEQGRHHWLAVNGIRPSESAIAVVTRLEAIYPHELRAHEATVHTIAAADPDGRGADLRFSLQFTQRLSAIGIAASACLVTVQVAFIDSKTRRPCSLASFLSEEVI
jgi:acyl-CoA thioesterase FadM